MSKMVERVARAIIKEAGFDPDQRVVAGTNCTRLEAYLPSVRAAIAAMREPTEEMIEAAGSEHAAVPPREAWQAMIDEALR